MVRQFVFLSCVALAFSTASTTAEVIDFQDLAVPASGYFNGDPGTLSPGQSVAEPWQSGGVSFANLYGIDSYGGFNYEYWNGFAYSNVVDTTDPAFTNQYASFPGGGYQTSTYAVAFGDGAAFTLPVPGTVAGFRIANTTYAALTMRDGDQYGFSAPLPPGGWFATTATGRLNGSPTGTATYYLADLRGTLPPGILASWDWFDLSGLGVVESVEFTFSGSDTGTFGLNTPAYFAMDALTVNAVPEPAGWGLLAAGWAAILSSCRRSRRQSCT
jgi:hypothetical protein